MLNKEMESITRNTLARNVKVDSNWLDVGCGPKQFANSLIMHTI